MKDITTTDLSKFGYKEWLLARELIDAMIDQGFPEDFENNEVTIMFNRNSGHVFLTNADYQVAMINGNDLESWYTCFNCGHEGFKKDCQLDHENDCCNECK